MTRIRALDGLRGIAVLLVVIHHAAPTGVVRLGGPFGVTLFFVLSGYLITTLLLRERSKTGSISLARFYWRRTVRLFPALALFLVVTPVIHGYALDAYVQMVKPVVTYTASFVRASGYGLGPLSHTWSLAVEEHFYLLWPAVLGLVAVRKTRRVVLVLLCLALLWRVYLNLTAGFDRTYWSSDGSAFALLAGCMLAVHLHERHAPLPRPLAHVGILGVVGASLIPVSPIWDAVLWGTIPVVVLSVLAVWGCLERTPAVENRVLVWFGAISYPLYLWHQMLFKSSLLTGQSTVARGVIIGGISVAIAWASWTIVERPLLKRGHRFANRRWDIGGEVAGLEASPSPSRV